MTNSNFSDLSLCFWTFQYGLPLFFVPSRVNNKHKTFYWPKIAWFSNRHGGVLLFHTQHIIGCLVAVGVKCKNPWQGQCHNQGTLCFMQARRHKNLQVDCDWRHHVKTWFWSTIRHFGRQGNINNCQHNDTIKPCKTKIKNIYNLLFWQWNCSLGSNIRTRISVYLESEF